MDFEDFAKKASLFSGASKFFALNVLLIIGWAAAGPFFQFSDTWQLVVNTGTTVVTYLLVILIQNTQNRDATAIHAKLDELLAGVTDANEDLQHIENESLDHIEETRPS